MAVYITQGLYLSGNLDDGYRNANNPLIGYENLLETGSVSADSAADDNPASNVKNISTGEYWLSTDSVNVQYLTMQIPAGKVNYFALAGHNLAGAELKLQRRDDPGDAWTDVTTAVIPGDNSAILWFFEDNETSVYWRLYIEPAEGVAPRIAIVYIGEVLVLQRRVYVGHAPAVYNAQSQYRTGVSQSSQYLGRVIRRQTLQFSLDQQNVEPDFYRTYIDPFRIHAETKPFFAAWRPSKYPEEVAFCWTTRDIGLTNQSANGFIQFDIVGNALAPLETGVSGEVSTT